MEVTDREYELIKDYLLGRLGEEQEEGLETRLLTADEFKEKVLLVEGELVEEYVGGGLSAADRESFDRHFLRTPRQRQRVVAERALRDYAVAHAGKEAAEEEAEEEGGAGVRRGEVGEEKRRGRLAGAFGWMRRPWVVAGVALAVLVLAFGGPAQVRLWQLRAVEAELAELNRPGASDADGRLAAAIRQPLLPARRLRTLAGGAAEPPRLEVADAGRLVRFSLPILDGEYESYRAVFRTKGDETREAGGEARKGRALFAVGGLKAEGGREVVVYAPARLFTEPEYVIQLVSMSGAGREAKEVEVDAYPFRPARP